MAAPEASAGGPPAFPLQRLTEGKILSLREEFGLDIAVALSLGRVHAFDEICTHRRCSLVLGEIYEGRVACPCHGAEFDLATGAVLEGPATEPIGTYPVTVEHDMVVVAIPDAGGDSR
jgi:3-phenylpropionate/trans-cinnamate dioxygenase ferredoxin subunit